MKNAISPGVHENLEEMLNDCSIDAIIATDTSINVIAWNATAEKLYHKKKAEVIGRPLLEIIPSMATDEETIKAIQLAQKGIKSFVPSSKKILHRLHAENHFIPLKDESGVKGIMNLVHDVAHRIKAEELLQQLNDELQVKNNELRQRNDELISLGTVASQDMKEPLKKIYTAVESIILNEAQNFSNNGKAHLRRIQSASQRMGLITDDLLSFTEIAQGGHEFAMVDLNYVLNEAQQKVKKIIEDKNAVIQSGKLPCVKGIHNLLVQLFRNILHNAVKFQPDHIPIINIINEAVDVKGKMFTRISFTDNGIGFNNVHAQQIFNLFTKVHESEKFHGSGMGLAVSKKIMEQHRGLIEAISEQDKGTTIHCYFPL